MVSFPKYDVVIIRYLARCSSRYLGFKKSKYLKDPNLTFFQYWSLLMLPFYLLSVNKPMLGFLLKLLNFTVLPVHTFISDGGTWLLFDRYRYVSLSQES